MIVFQLSPCRVYPKIINKIRDQFPSYRFVHEVCEFKNSDATWGSVELENNPLKLTPNNYQFRRCDFICGIFSKNKINKQNGDFWLTIKLPEERILQEFFCAIKYYGSPEYAYSNRSSESDIRLNNIYRRLFNFSYEEFISLVKNKKINSTIGDKIYNVREDIVPNGDFDYVGNFDNWRGTIEDIKNLINLDLSSLKNERLYSYKN